jgi:hypothetical protein
MYRQVQHHGLQRNMAEKDSSHFIQMMAATTFTPVWNVTDTLVSLLDAGYPYRKEPASS